MDLGEFLLPGTGLRPLGLIIAPNLLAILAEPTASVVALSQGCVVVADEVPQRADVVRVAPGE
jgi:hypothetical protein